MATQNLCNVDGFNWCKDNFCCLGDDALLQVIAYLFGSTVNPNVTAQQFLASSSAPPSFSQHDFLVALACIALSAADSTEGGLDLLVKAQQHGYHQISREHVLLLIAMFLCLQVNPLPE